MKAYILEDPHIVKSVGKEIPIIKEDEVLVKVTNVGLCGSDIHLFNGTYNGPFQYPMLFGHEWSGIVEKVGKKVIKFQPGDKVTGDCSKYCGECDICQKDRNLCDSIEKFGITIDGASAEYIARQEKYLYKAPQDLDLDLICLTEPIAVAAHLLTKIVKNQHDIQNKKILIYGGGAIGIAALLLLKEYYGCPQVDLFDLIENRTELAKSLGANIPSSESLNQQLDRTDYDSIYSGAAYDIVIETTGNAKVFENTLNLVKPLGIIGCVGMIPSATINQKLIVVKALTIVGSIGGTGEFPKVLEFIKKNPELIKKLISHKFPANELNKAFEACKDPSKVMKVEILL